MKKYAIKEIFYTLQGEGFHVGRAAVFCRFSGCNLWNGLEKDRKTAICQFCDTDFWGTDGENGGKYDLTTLVKKIKALWPKDQPNCFLVCTGGEPALQIDDEFISALHAIDFEIAIETNGTLALPEGLDWICMSPKAGTDIVLKEGDELKLVYPQQDIDPAQFQSFRFVHHYLQPMDNEDRSENILACLEFIKNNPVWKLSLQTHKILGIP